MNPPRRTAWMIVAPLIMGVALLALTIAQTDIASISAAAKRLGFVLPVALLPSAVWHLLRTIAWHQCFPARDRPSFARVFRLRLAAEAFAFVTVSSIAGDPLKVVLLKDEVSPSTAAVAVALERVLYLVVTTAVVSAVALIAVATLPLSTVWVWIFLGIAVVPVVLILTLVLWARRRQPTRVREEPRSAVRRKILHFLRAFDTDFRNALRNDRSRLAWIGLIEAAAYAAMALEIWLPLRLTGTPIRWTDAFALEAFTRATSLATAFIPANIGALEASNVAGAAGLHVAAAGGLVLAMIRRVRGLAWCAAGFLVYPRPPGNRRQLNGATRLVVDRDTAVGPGALLGGLPVGERMAREAARAGFGRLLVWSPHRSDAWRAATRRAHSAIEVRMHSDVEPPADAAESRVEFAIESPDDLAAAERALRASIIKPTDGHLARLNRRISIPISIALVRAFRFNANVMSILVLALGFVAGWLFARGDYVSGVLAAFTSWAASVLDGCDGELARLQYSESAFGCWVDTLGDYLYYFSVFAGVTVGSVRATRWTGFWWVGAAVGAGLLLTFALLIVLRGRTTNGRPEQLNARTKAHFYASGDRWKWLVAKLSNCGTRATMPYGILAFAVLGLLPELLVLAAVSTQIYWISLMLELRGLLGMRTQAAAG